MEGILCDITIVFQGAIVRSVHPEDPQMGVTAYCLQKTRRALPKAKIILSTWEHDEEFCKLVDHYVVNEDPGSLRPPGSDKSYFENINRQIVSSSGGLAQVTTKYAAKIRTDSYLEHAGFVQEFLRENQEPANTSIFQRRIVICSYNSVQPTVWPAAYYFADFFCFGLTEDVQLFWNADPASQKLATRYERSPKAWWRGGEGDRPEQIAAEQYLVTNCLQRSGVRVRYETMLTMNGWHFLNSEMIFARNFLALSSDQIGLRLPDRLTVYDCPRHFCYRRDSRLAQWGGRHPGWYLLVCIARLPLFFASVGKAISKFYLRPLARKVCRKLPLTP